MGAALSSHNAGHNAEKSVQWLLDYQESAIKYASSVSLEAFDKDGVRYLAVAYHASDSPHVCSPTQHLRFALSKDGGETWTPSRVAMWGLGPLWSPVLFHDAATARLFLFYSESRKAYSPGGDIKYITSTDLGVTWSPPVTIHTHEADGEVPKVTVNRPAVDADGNWYLGFHSEPPESFKTFNEGTWCALQEAGDAVPKLTAPRTAAGQGVTTQAGVLTSTDGGATWDVAGHIEDPKTWLIDPAIECTSKGGLLALFRTGAGKIYASKSADKGKTWSKAAPLALPNPNSKFATITIDGQMLLVHNPSVKDRSSLSLALSVDEGRTWETLTVVDGGGAGADVKFTHPSITQWNDDTVKVAYTVWDRGLKLATIKLATVEG